jgi:hypothetical protein
VSATKKPKPKPQFRHLINTPLQRDRCKVCRQTIGVAHADGVPIRLDLRLLDLPAEIVAVCNGLATFELLRIGTRFELRFRSPYYINLDTQRGRPMVMTQHVCEGAR